ncbi:formate dehydrogenase subunit gamma [Campylobacter gastrosuis]|uniref:Formate dehydrogenase subunit gamma n=1 Tax=Campylobacter gastrosuis TaxID=2974576 RepID=A0ABT7HP97_9BACT|nr:formate dehydrogenase subunit gamma [Campylobacter gastrosuis]MDL0088532.1 formate dehydrogenase subunit gamma [Campylobacter gastrosuis]
MRILTLFLLAINAFALHLPDGTNQFDSKIWGADRVTNIEGYESGLGKIFTFLQGNEYFAYGVLLAILGVVLAFTLHFLLIGPKHFSHDGKKVYAFSLIERLAHGLAGISWVVLVPTGIIMMWGSTFGGGSFVRFAKNSHGIATILFAIAVLPLLFAWIKRMMPTAYDLKWMLMLGGYLSKDKKCIPAGKFNAGQKQWFWVAIPGGILMIATGACMYFLDFKEPAVATWLGISQIELLRLAAIIHNVLGIICALFFLIHIYMAVIAIHGAIWAMITGYKEEEEVYVLHHYWYNELVSKNKIPASDYEKIYPKL